MEGLLLAPWASSQRCHTAWWTAGRPRHSWCSSHRRILSRRFDADHEVGVCIGHLENLECQTLPCHHLLWWSLRSSMQSQIAQRMAVVAKCTETQCWQRASMPRRGRMPLLPSTTRPTSRISNGWGPTSTAIRPWRCRSFGSTFSKEMPWRRNEFIEIASYKVRSHRTVLWHGWRRRGRKELDGDGDDVRRRVLSDQFSTEHGLESCQQWPEAPGESPQARHARQSCSRSGQRWWRQLPDASDSGARHDGASAPHGHQDALHRSPSSWWTWSCSVKCGFEWIHQCTRFRAGARLWHCWRGERKCVCYEQTCASSDGKKCSWHQCVREWVETAWSWKRWNVWSAWNMWLVSCFVGTWQLWCQRSVFHATCVAYCGTKRCNRYEVVWHWEWLELFIGESSEEVQRGNFQTQEASGFGCPPCGPFSQMTRISKWKEDGKERQRKLVEGRIVCHGVVWGTAKERSCFCVWTPTLGRQLVGRSSSTGSGIGKCSCDSYWPVHVWTLWPPRTERGTASQLPSWPIRNMDMCCIVPSPGPSLTKLHFDSQLTERNILTTQINLSSKFSQKLLGQQKGCQTATIGKNRRSNQHSSTLHTSRDDSTFFWNQSFIVPKPKLVALITLHNDLPRFQKMLL